MSYIYLKRELEYWVLFKFLVSLDDIFILLEEIYNFLLMIKIVKYEVGIHTDSRLIWIRDSNGFENLDLVHYEQFKEPIHCHESNPINRIHKMS